MKRIYLDHAATTPVRPEALEAMLPLFTQRSYNPSSAHAEGRSARAALDDARARVASVLGAKSKEIVFTSGGSEAANLALLGTARAAKPSRKRCVALATEHHAVLHTLEALKMDGCDVAIVSVHSSGLPDMRSLRDALNEQTVLVSAAYANNELGTIAPIADMAAAAHACGALFFTDAVQAPLYLPLEVNALGVDLLSLAAHKFHGPPGAGVLYVREGTPLAPMFHGGSQEAAKRAGTENVPAIAGLARALELAAAERERAVAQVASLRDRFENEVVRRIPDARVNGTGAPRIAGITSISFAGVASDALLLRLDLEGLAVSAGSACASGALQSSHVLTALGLAEPWTRGVARFSFGRATTEGDIEYAVAVLERVVPELRAIGSIGE